MRKIYLLLIVFAVLLFLIPRADANTSGQKLVQQKRDYWSMTRDYVAPDGVGTGVHIETYVVSVAPDYYYWSNAPDSVNRMAMKSFSVCYTRISGRGSLFQGVTVNPYFSDDNDTVNPGPLTAADDDTAGNCASYTIPASDRVWFRMDQDPGWSAKGSVNIKFQSDDDFTFRINDTTTKYFHPGSDTNIGDPVYIDGNYGGH